MTDRPHLGFALTAALLAVCLLTGCHGPRPAAAPPPPPEAGFVDVAQVAGIRFRLGHPDRAHIDILQGIGHGCAFLDFDGDGRLDILLVGSEGAHLYRNLDGARFEDVTPTALPPPPGKCHFLGCSVADYDGDGRPDIFLTGYGSTALYHNEGGARFRDVTAGSGLEARSPYDWTTSAAWADVDGDGRLDLYVCRYVEFTPSSKAFCGQKALDGGSLEMACPPTAYAPQRGSLYRNLGRGRFKDVTQASGLSDTHGNGLGCLFCDFNGDGRPDLYVANDLKLADLYVNLGGGRFRNVGAESGTALGADGAVMSGMGVDWGDFDNDGRFDLLAANYARQPKSLYHNEGRGAFTNQAFTSGIGAPSLLPLTFGSSFVDVDNDGWLDIVFVNGHVDSLAERVDPTTSYLQRAQLFRNLGSGQFTDASAQAGPDFTRSIAGRAVAVGDFDSDGAPDLLVVDEEGSPLLLHNRMAAGRHWITLRCLARSGGPPAVGARVTAKAGRLSMIREVRCGGSFLSSDEPVVHFGLGTQGAADYIEVRWPDGKRSVYRGVPGDATYEIVENSGAPRRVR